MFRISVFAVYKNNCTISSNDQARDERAQRRAATAQRARVRFQEQLALQQQQAMAQPIDPDIQAAIAEAIRVAVEAVNADLVLANNQIATLQTESTTLRNELTQAQADVTAAQRAAIALAARGAPAAGPTAAPTFALGPATVTGNIIDYSTTAGIKLFKMAGDQLKSEFDLDNVNFSRFTDNLHSRAVENGWDKQIMLVNNIYILRNYGTLTYASVLTHVQAYAFTDSRSAQDSTNLFNCLENTLTKEAMATMYAERQLYTLTRAGVVAAGIAAGGLIPGADTDEFRDGVLFLWAVINRTTAQTNATISAIINQLTRLNIAMEESKHDIKEFNTKIRDLLNQYTANRRHEYDQTILINSLFSAYKMTKDREFTMYVTRKQQDHDDNTKIMTANSLMEDALKFFQTRKTLKEWEQDSDDVKEIINLSAQLKTSNSKISALEKKLDGKGKDGEKKKDGGTGGKGKNINKKQYEEGLTPEEYRKKRRDDAPNWMKRRPKNPTPTSTLEKDGKTYKWCDKHRLWCYHNTLECTLKKQEKNDNSNTKNEGGGGSKKDDKDKEGGQAGGKVQFGPHTSMVMDGWDY